MLHSLGSRCRNKGNDGYCPPCLNKLRDDNNPTQTKGLRIDTKIARKSIAHCLSHCCSWKTLSCMHSVLARDGCHRDRLLCTREIVVSCRVPCNFQLHNLDNVRDWDASTLYGKTQTTGHGDQRTTYWCQPSGLRPCYSLCGGVVKGCGIYPDCRRPRDPSMSGSGAQVASCVAGVQHSSFGIGVVHGKKRSGGGVNLKRARCDGGPFVAADHPKCPTDTGHTGYQESAKRNSVASVERHHDQVFVERFC